MSESQKSPFLDVSKMPVEQGVNKLISYAVNLPASDIFFHSNEHNVTVGARYLGLVQTISVLPADVGRRQISHIKALASMDVTEKRRPLDGRWIHRSENGTVVDLRINMIPTLYGEDLSIRILSRDRHLFTLEHLGMTQDQLNVINGLFETPSGLVLISGPTGSGKTATLYAALQKLNNGRRKINTIEDPVEFTIDGLRQSQINPQIELTFATLLRSVLRQSPDVIMIGEIRDHETAETAVRAANSGHLVLATIHAPVAAAAVQSIRSLGVHPHFLSTSLRGCISQRLVRTLCPACKVTFDLTYAPHTFDEVRPWLGNDEGKVLFAPKGCPQCQMTGYSGRIGIFEVLPVTKEIRGLIAENRPTREIRTEAVREKMLEFRQAALLKVAKGITSTEEVFRVIPSEHLLEDNDPSDVAAKPAATGPAAASATAHESVVHL
jgi:type II secretory ATPase GspE/PulE/Tfp pilus assembly ATPase PilB-like protein